MKYKLGVLFAWDCQKYEFLVNEVFVNNETDAIPTHEYDFIKLNQNEETESWRLKSFQWQVLEAGCNQDIQFHSNCQMDTLLPLQDIAFSTICNPEGKLKIFYSKNRWE